jgi:hypothetical protein
MATSADRLLVLKKLMIIQQKLEFFLSHDLPQKSSIFTYRATIIQRFTEQYAV